MKNCLVRSSSNLLLILFFSVQSLSAKTPENSNCVAQMIPLFESVKYRTAIDVMNKHLSGILIFKTQEDSSVRAVFLNEMGIVFFDITFTKKAYLFNSIFEGLDKKAVRKTLAKDIGMILMKGIIKSYTGVTILEEQQVYTFKLKSKGSVKYTTDQSCSPPIKIENFGRRKAVVSISQFYNKKNSMPDSIFVQHHKVNFTINLKQMHVTK